MICEHLREIEAAMKGKGIRETYRGQAWSRNCREWVYFDCWIDVAAVQKAFALAECVKEHVHKGTHDGEERGIECEQCKDAIMGRYEKSEGVVVFPG